MQYANITETGVLVRGFGVLDKVIVNSHTSGTLKLIDGTENGTPSTAVLTSTDPCVPASHAESVLTSSGAMVAGTHAVSVFTSSGVVVDGQTITIGTTVYRAKAILERPYDVAMGASATEFLANLRKAINGMGTGFYIGTAAHPSVVATGSDETTLTIRGRVPGTSLNALATTETFTNGSWADTTLGGGTGASDPGVTVAAATATIGDITYTVVDALSETYGATAVPYQVVKGASEATMLDNLKLAINGTGTAGTHYSTGTLPHPDVVATTNTDTTQTVVARTVGDDDFTTAINDLPTTETMANTAWADTTLGGGANDSEAAVSTDDALITIGDRTYTAVLQLSETSGADPVADQILWETSEAVFLDNLKKAINETGVAGTDYSTGTGQNSQVVATTNADDAQTIQSRMLGASQNAIVTTTTLANYAWGAGTMENGTGTDGKVICDTITLAVGERLVNVGEIDFTYGLLPVIGGTANLTITYR
jgi:hypothetical protein